MEKKNIEKREKPKEILEIEQAYGIKLKQVRLNNINWDFVPFNSFSINHANKINAISICEKGITDIKPISILPDLEYINFTLNQIKDISPLGSRKSLRFLLLGGNLIEDISPISQLHYLNGLYIWGNPIKDFSPLSQLHELRELACQRTGLENLGFIANHRHLHTLRIGENQIKDIAAIVLLSNLKLVNLDNNYIRDISILKNFNTHANISLISNLIKQVPRDVAERFHLLNNPNLPFSRRTSYLSLFNNPLSFPPPSVIELGPETTQNYYEMSEQFGHAPLSEGRVIVIGDGSSGKSSLIEKLLYNSFQLGREQTNGIKIEHLHLPHPEDGRDLTFHIWDFGGQEIQHAVHKFFFTEGCLYVLVLDNRKEEDPEYWLQQIESLGGSAPVLVVFNKQDENPVETADRKYLKEKYPNIVGFYNTSCQTGFGIDGFKKDLEKQVVQLRTVEEQFPNNWLAIKKTIEERTSGSQHYLTYEVYQEICKQNHAATEETQRLLLKYLNTIGSVTWFGEDIYLKFFHVLNPAWITQGVYKILTARKTANLFGQVNVSDFKELLQPVGKNDYTYDEQHYGYILSMMKKFDLCYTPDDMHLLIPSAFAKVPKVEYSEFRGENIRTYILQFKDYMPLALIHRYTAKKMPQALDKNYWYTGIVIEDNKSDAVAMVHADKDAKRIYIRIRGANPLGLWEHVRREFNEITSSYAKIPYDELVALDEKAENTVNYTDLIGHLQADKTVYFHPRLKKDYNVGYLMGMFETKEGTIEKFEKGEIQLDNNMHERPEKVPPYVINILNNISPTVNTNVDIRIDIDIQLINTVGSNLKGDASYLLEELGRSNKELQDALKKIVQFADDAKAARNSGDVAEKGWGRKLKNIIGMLSENGDKLKKIKDGAEVLVSLYKGIHELSKHFHLADIGALVSGLIN